MTRSIFYLGLAALFVSATPATGRDFGTLGTTWTIAEPDLLEAIHARLRTLEESGELAAINRKFVEAARATIEHPHPVPGVTPATADRQWLFDPTVTFLCSQQEMLLDVQDRMGLCHYVGEYCSQKALFVCTTERLSYCCYQSELARVIQEQGRVQLGIDFGTPQTPNCSGFTVAQFSQLDLSKMDFSEVYANFTSAVSLPSSLQTSAQIQQQVQQYYQNAGATGTQTGTNP